MAGEFLAFPEGDYSECAGKEGKILMEERLG